MGRSRDHWQVNWAGEIKEENPGGEEGQLPEPAGVLTLSPFGLSGSVAVGRGGPVPGSCLPGLPVAV